MRFTFSRLGLLMGLSTAAVLGLSDRAHADLVQAYTFKNVTYSQSGSGGASISSTGAFFNAGATISVPGQFDGATVTLPGGSMQNLPATSTTSFVNGPSFATKAAMDAAYPMGTYTITVTDSSGTNASQSSTLNYTADAYASNIPALTATTYNALQGLSTTATAFTIGFNAQTASSLATNAYTFFTIFGSSEGCGFLSPSATSCQINPSNLTPNTQYTYELDFSDRIEATDANGVLDGVDFDVRTDGTFTTAAVSAVPLPAALPLFGTAVVGLIGVAKRRRSA